MPSVPPALRRNSGGLCAAVVPPAPWRCGGVPGAVLCTGMSLSIRAAIQQAAVTLESSGVASPFFDAQTLAAAQLGCARGELLFRGPEDFPPQALAAFEQAVRRRAAREPLQHILGTAPFGELELQVGPGVFIPRPETELLAQWATATLEKLPAPVVVDLCTGSGALAALLAHRFPGARIIAVEQSEAAARYARANLPDSVQLRIGDATELGCVKDLCGSVDVVVSNPPYVPEGTATDVETSFDPHEAVFSGTEGMDVITRLVPVAHALLRSGGALGVEHDSGTAALVTARLREHGGFRGIETHQDFTHRDRFVTASKV